MILERISFFLEQSYRHDAYQSDCLQSIAEKLEDILRAIGEPSGRVTFSGQVPVDKRELQKAFRDRRLIEVDAVQMEFEFSQNLFMSIDPKLNTKIKEILDDSQLIYLRDTLKAFQHLNELMGQMESEREKVLADCEKTRELLGVDISQLIQAKSEDDKKALSAMFEEVRKLKGQVHEGLTQMNTAIRLTEKMQAEASNEKVLNKPATRGINMR